MINAEKYRDELLEILNENRYIEVDKYDRKIRKCTGNNCPKCMFGITALGKGRDSCSIAAMLWLVSEYKEVVRLSRLEYELLKYCLCENYEYIVRDEYGALRVFSSKPEKVNSVWEPYENNVNLEPIEKLFFKKLFNFIKCGDREPTSIKNVFDNCEVVENE